MSAVEQNVETFLFHESYSYCKF